jgi:hypothetical protein
MMPMDAMAAIAYGDLASAILAMIAVIFLRYRLVGAISVAWLVNIVTSLEWLYAAFVAFSRQLATYAMGGNSYIMNYYVPVIAVIHVMIFARRIRDGRAQPDSPSLADAVTQAR